MAWKLRQGSDLVDAFNTFWAEKVSDGTVLETATTYGLQGVCDPRLSSGLTEYAKAEGGPPSAFGRLSAPLTTISERTIS